MIILDTRREAALHSRVANRLNADKVADVATGDMIAEGSRNLVLRVKCRHRAQSVRTTNRLLTEHALHYFYLHVCRVINASMLCHYCCTKALCILALNKVYEKFI